jgi:Icc-related predicted phosphoesterase
LPWLSLIEIMKCVAVSDMHLKEVATPEADMLLVAGDMTMTGAGAELAWFEDWLTRQPQKLKVWIAGNHELGLEANPDWAARMAQRTNTIYLEDSGIEVAGVSIWGSPVSPWFFDWAFNRQRGADIRKHWQLIPEGTDILMTHGPPHGHLDFNYHGEHLGCADLIDVIENQLSYPPQVMIFGHIHYAYGVELLKRPDGKVIKLINASNCNEQYSAVNPPVVFEI